MMQRVSVIFQLFLVAAVLTAVQGCNNEDGPTGPEPGVVATIANIWPHEDGNSWTYDLHNSFAADNDLVLYENLEDVPLAAIDLDSLYTKLQVPIDPDSTTMGIFRNEFDGLVTTESGVTAMDENGFVPGEKKDPLVAVRRLQHDIPQHA